MRRLRGLLRGKVATRWAITTISFCLSRRALRYYVEVTLERDREVGFDLGDQVNGVQ